MENRDTDFLKKEEEGHNPPLVKITRKGKATRIVDVPIQQPEVKDHKVLYCVVNANSGDNGVNRKIVSQIKALNKAGVNCTAVMIGEGLGAKGIWDMPCIKVEVKPVKKGLFRHTRFKARCIKALYHFLRKRPDKTELVYLRYPFANRSLYRLCRKFGKRMVAEFNTKEIEEIKFLSTRNTFGFRPSRLLGWLEHSVLALFHEKYYGAKCLRKIAAYVAPTKEILDYEIERGGKKAVKTLTLGNGIGCDDITALAKKTYNGKDINLVFLDGGCEGNNWHGIENLASALGYHPKDNMTIRLTIFGNEPYWARNNGYITVHKQVPREELNQFLCAYDMGVSSFALSRKGLSQASTLKAREYVARGLPVLFGHYDEDLEPLVKKKLCLRLFPDREVQRAELVSFIREFYANPKNRAKLRMYALLNLDYGVKMKKLADFMGQF